MKSTLPVWWNGTIVGRLTLNEHSDMGLAYRETWLADPQSAAHLPRLAQT